MKKKDNQKDLLSENSLSAEEIHILRTQFGKEGRDRSQIPPPENPDIPKPIRYAKKNAAVVIIVSIAVIMAIVVTILLCFVLFSTSSCRDQVDYTLLLVNGEEEEELICRAKDHFIDGELYLDMNKLADFAGMTRSGTQTRMKFIASATQYLEFEHQSEYATVNGKTLLLPIPVYMRDGVCMVPYAVISRLIDGGLTFKRDAAEHIITISRVGYYEEDRWICDELSFTDKDFDVFSAVQSIPAAPYEYSIDISEYLAYIDPADTAPYLILANREHAITEDPKNLTDIPAKWTGASSSTKDYKMDAGATQALIAMMSAMEADGVKDVFVTSAYRSYERQAALFAQYVSEEMAEHGCSREEAEALVLEYSARPGTSEHQTGLCIDFMTNGMKELNNEFENTAAFRWLSENAHQYGFILRYPAHKTDIVGYSYESWHYRFVGKTIACEIYEKDLTLEEYLKK